MLCSFFSVTDLFILLIVCDFLQSCEIFSALFIKFLFNVRDSEQDSWEDDELKGVYSSVGDFNDLIQGYELSLQGRNINKSSQELGESVFALLNGLTTSSETKH
jgi:hypothetical protein